MVKTEFSIKDLENLSGVKAHTIRIWEKRYNLLTPERTDTNIRIYNLDNLKKLLSVTQLYNGGHKISKIASLSDIEINKLSKNSDIDTKDAFYINEFKTAMFSFDYKLFDKTFNEMEQGYSFYQSFVKIIIPLLVEIGYLWQIGTIDPVHERYISELIRQKITIHNDKALANFKEKSDKIIALYLPFNEIHDLGLLFAQYIAINAGVRTLYLGSNIPLESLTHVTKHHDNIIFMTYLTTEPTVVDEYLVNFNKKVCATKSYDLWCLGSKAKEINQATVTNNIKVYTDIETFKAQINSLTHV